LDDIAAFASGDLGQAGGGGFVGAFGASFAFAGEDMDGGLSIEILHAIDKAWEADGRMGKLSEGGADFVVNRPD